MKDTLEFDLAKFLENGKKLKKVVIDFEKCLNSDIIGLEENLKNLFETNDQFFIYNELIKLDLNTITVSKVGRLQTILTYMNQKNLDLYRKFFEEKNKLKDLIEKPERPTKVSPDVIKEYNSLIISINKQNKEIIDWNTKVSTLKEYLDSIIFIDIYGDKDIDVSRMPYVYFKFLNTDKDEIEIFMSELKNCSAPPVKKIRSIRIEDISGKLPAFLKSANEVRVYFNTEDEALELHGSKDYVEGVYQKYIIKNNTMTADGGEWGMYNKRKENLNNEISQDYMNTTPVSLNDGELEEDEIFNNNDYEVELSNCYYAKKLEGEEVLYAIVPKDYWNKYGTILTNKNMFIVGISDDRKWRRSDIYFKRFGDEDEANEYLESESEYSEELSEYINNEDMDDEDDFDDNNDDNQKYTSASDFYYSIGLFEEGLNISLCITPKKYWNINKCLSDTNDGAEKFIIGGYELFEEMESVFTLAYNDNEIVEKISEVIMVMDKSGFEYSWEMQNFLDENALGNGNLDSNKYNNYKDYFSALKNKMGQ